jgi:hypothetical protein
MLIFLMLFILSSGGQAGTGENQVNVVDADYSGLNRRTYNDAS